MKERLRDIFLDLLEEIALGRAMRARIACRDGVLEVGGERIDLGEYKKVLVCAVGKAAAPMAEEFARIVAPRRVSGIVVSSVEVERPPEFFLAYRGGHPYPNAQSVHAAEVALEMLNDLKPRHLVVYLLSGGGSAVFEKPIDPSISIDDLREFYRLLVTCGANIVDMNVLRKRFSAVKGGRLAERAHPARQVTIYVSDVPPGRDSSVASGPTMPDESTVEQARELAERLGLRDSLPAPYRRLLDEDGLSETPKPGAPIFDDSSWHCLLDNSAALEAVERRAAGAGWLVETDLSVDDRPVAEAADALLARLESLRAANPGRTVAVLTGGELSSPVLGDGRGGRNTAFVLDCVPKIAGRAIAAVSAGTDGVDGNSPAAGALADGETLARARAASLDPADFFARSDSYTFFHRLGDALETGPTGNNVRDVRLLVAW